MGVVAGKNSALKFSTAAGSTALSAVAQLVTVTPPQVTNPPVDVTTLDSTGRQFLGTIHDGGTVSLEIIWDQRINDHQRLQTLVHATTPEEYRLVASTTTITAFFRALVSDFNPQAIVVDNVVRASINLKVDGTVSYTTA